jgi:hypothetical protein
VQLGDYFPDEHKCTRSKLSIVIVAVNAHFHLISLNVIDNGTAMPLGAQYVQWVK